jgi:hypothetical protein
MKKFVLPRDFSPHFQKEYTVRDVTFRIAVQRMDLTVEKSPSSTQVLLWHFAIYVNDVMVEAGPFHWSTIERLLTDENVCNHLASFYKDSPQVQEGRPLGMPEPEKTHDRNFIIRALALVATLFYSDNKADPTGDLIVDSYINLGGMNSVMITNKYNSSMQYEIAHDSIQKKTTVTSYVEVDKYIIDDSEL